MTDDCSILTSLVFKAKILGSTESMNNDSQLYEVSISSIVSSDSQIKTYLIFLLYESYYWRWS